MDTKHPYWKYAELVNGRLAMLGLGNRHNQLRSIRMDSARFILTNEIQFTIHNSKKVQTNDSRSRKI